MRIDAIEHDGFGAVRPAPLALGPGWTVVYAPNEAGKSTLLRAVRAALFGRIPKLSADAEQPATAAWVQAQLSNGSGKPLVVRREMSAKERRKKSPSFDTEAKYDGQSLDEDQLRDRLGLSEGLGHGLTTVTQADLARGAATIGRLDDLLFGGGLGDVRRIADLQSSITDRLAAIRPNGRSNSRRPIDEAVRTIAAAAKRRKEAAFNPADYRDQIDRRRQRLRDADRLEAEADVAAAESDWLGRLLGACDQHTERMEVRGKREALDLSAPMGRDEAEAVLEDFRRRRELEAQRRSNREERQKLETLRSQVAATSPLDDLDEQTDAIVAESQLAERAAADAAAKREELSDVRGQLEALSDAAVIDGDGRALLKQVGRRVAALQRARDESRDARRTVTSTRREIESIEAQQKEQSDDEEPLQRAAAILTGIDRFGDLDDASRTLASRRRQLAAEHQALCDEAGLADDDGQPLPTATLAREVGEAMAFAQQAARDAALQVDHASSQLRAAEAELAEAEGAKAPPTRQRLDEARAEREDALTALIEAAASGDAIAPAETALRSAMRTADALADDRFDKATQVANAEKAARRLEAAKSEHAAAVEREHATRQALKDAGQPLAEKWMACGASPLGPGETLDWLERRADLVDRTREFEEESEQHAAAETEYTNAMEQLIKAVAEAGGPSDPDPRRWVAEQVESLRDRRAVREDAIAKLPGLRASLTAAEQAAAEAAEAVDEEAAGLADALAEAGLDPKLPSEEAEDAIRDAIEAARLRRSATTLEEAIARHEADIAAFEANLKTLRDALAGDERTRSLRDPAEIAAAARARRDERAARDERLEGIRSFDEGEAMLRTQIEEINAAIPDPASLGLPDLDAVETFARDSQIWREHEQVETSLRQSIRAFAPPGRADEFERALSEGNLDDWTEAKAERDDHAQQRLAEAKAARAEASEITGDLNRRGREETAQIERVNVQAGRAELREAIEQYAPLQILATMLSRAAESSKREEPPLLEKIGQLLADVTGGRHTAVERTDDDRLLVVGQTGGIPIRRSPDELSQGTRELLYLAVRFAFVRERSADQPIPFVLDDVLVNIDEDRQPAVLRVLSELAESTQVVLLTCHRRTVELAESLQTANLTTTTLA